MNFGDSQLEKFEETFRYSPFTQLIDSFDSGILGNITSVNLRKEITPAIGTAANYTINFSNRINNLKGSVTSSAFTYNSYSDCKLTDDQGTISITATGGVVVADSIGTVNYTTGQIVLNDFLPQSVGSGGKLSIIVKPSVNDVFLNRGEILSIISDDVSVTMKQEIQ